MRYFSTTSARVSTVRKEGYYPSKKTAAFLARKIGVVLQWSEAQEFMAQTCFQLGFPSWEFAQELFGHLDNNKRMKVDPWSIFPGSEIEVIKNLISWWSIDDEALREQKSFVVIDLNRGVSLVIVSRTNGEDPSRQDDTIHGASPYPITTK